MPILSVNICRELTMVTHAGNTEPTGHFKNPVPGRIRITREGLEGDHIADKVHHGGHDMAVYALSTEIHRFWSEQLGRTDLVPSTFGENLTIEGFPDDRVHIGDTFRIRSPDGSGGAGPLLQVSLPRAPCFKLGIAIGDPAFPKAFLATCRVGYYLRVLEEGTVAAGDTIELASTDPAQITVRDITHLMYFDQHNKAAAARAAQLPALKQSWRDRFAERAAS
jgi:MOSC domain-containing protein YiiM